MDEVSFRIAGGGTITQSEYENLDDDKKPELTLSEDGVPKVKSAIIGPNVTQESLIKEFEMEDARYAEIKETMLGEVTDKDDISKIKKLNTKIGKRVIQAMGLQVIYQMKIVELIVFHQMMNSTEDLQNLWQHYHLKRDRKQKKSMERSYRRWK